MKISIIGLGYVGLPLSLVFCEAGLEVLGLDIDEKKTDSLNKGKSYIKHITDERISNAVKTGRLSADTDFSRVNECDAVLICVPTPLSKHREPDLSYVLNTGKTISPFIKKGTLVVLESTTYPGTTEEELKKVLEEGSELEAGKDFHLAYSPEREDPGNPNNSTKTIPKVVGGFTPECLKKAVELYEKALDKVVPVSSCRVAEATKLMENIFRCVNIALVNELKMIYDKMNIDIFEVIEAAKTKPFGYMPFYPGPGLGGHCIPIDPFYLTWKAREYGEHTRFIELAGEINTKMPDYVVKQAIEKLNEVGKSVKGARVLLLGLAYKANVDDDRESPSYVIMEKLEHLGAIVEYNDPHIPVIRPSREYSKYAGKKSVEISSDFDLIILVTNHEQYSSRLSLLNEVEFLDARGRVKLTNASCVS